MSFSSLSFYLFLAFVLALHRLLPWSMGRLVLLSASYYFYSTANPFYCLILLGSTSVDYVVAIRMHRSSSTRARKGWLLLSLVTNLGLLGSFKYGGFFTRNLNALLGSWAIDPLPVPCWVLPIGISFYTFQTLSYTIDVYRGKTEPCRSLVTFALYVSFFPQLVAGPIERANHLIPQLSSKQPITLGAFELGLQRVLWGLVKKLVFADRFALMVDDVWLKYDAYGSSVLMVAMLAFCAQIYLDFSAYTDIAIGTAGMMGIRLSENFKWPLLARNVVEMWARWHITLTNWFRDYVFEPLGGSRRSQPVRSAINVVIVMVLIGLWHGARWNFVLFGLYWGLLIVGYLIVRAVSNRLTPRRILAGHWWSRWVGMMVMMPFAAFSTVFFRSPDLATIRGMISRLVAGPWDWSPVYWTHAGLIVFLTITHIARGTRMARARKELAMPAPLRGAFWALMVLMIIYLKVDRSVAFVYFQF